jgi:ADP-ribose pyrophosphatase
MTGRHEKRTASEIAFDGRLVRVRVDQVELPSGRESVREVVEHPGAVGILPVTAEGNVILVRQFRYAIGRELLEIPAGTREPDEPPEVCAARELREETGFVADVIEPLLRFFVSPGWCTEELIVYRATGLSQTGADPEDDEVIEPVEVRPGEIPGLMRDGSIADAKTVTALLAYLSDPSLGP